MTNYEAMFILRPDLEEEKVAEIMDRFRTLVENRGGEVTRLEKWGKRRLAYEIQHLREGLYIILRFKGNTEIVQELDRVFKISDEVIRHMIVRTAA
ncbi:MAG: 30S ribosomal protein S6 [Armatimonadetes bacterium]|nr:30S ribosomal protein S6 [Armatimonadota bacterium]